MKRLLFLILSSGQSLALDIGSRDLLELKVEGDQVVHWQGDGFELGCTKSAVCLVDGSKFSRGSYTILYFKDDKKSEIVFDSLTLEISKSRIKQKHNYQLLLRQRVKLDQSFAALLSGVGFLDRNGKKSIVKNLPENIAPGNVFRTAGESRAFIHESPELSFLLFKDSQLKLRDSHQDTHVLQGSGLIRSKKEVKLQVGDGLLKTSKELTRVLIYTTPLGKAVLPLEGEFEFGLRSQKVNVKAPFGVLIGDKNMAILSRLSCDDPIEFDESEIPFDTNCKEVDLDQLGDLLDSASKSNLKITNSLAKIIDLSSIALDLSPGDSGQKAAYSSEDQLRMGILRDTSLSDPFQVRMKYLLRSKDCEGLASQEPGSADEESLYQYYTSLCDLRSSKNQRARNQLLWSKKLVSKEISKKAMDSLLHSENLKSLTTGSISVFLGRDSNGFLKGSDPTQSPFKAYSERITPFFGASMKRSWELLQEGPLVFRLDLSAEGRGYVIQNQIPYARHAEILKMPVILNFSKEKMEESEQNKEKERTIEEVKRIGRNLKVHLAPILSLTGNGYPLETIGSGLEVALEIGPLEMKTSALSFDDFNSEPEVFDYLSGNPLVFSSPVSSVNPIPANSTTKSPLPSDRPYTTRATSLLYGFDFFRVSQSLYLEHKRSRYLKEVENNQSFTGWGGGAISRFPLLPLVDLEGTLHYERRNYIAKKKGAIINLNLKTTWDFSPHYSTYLRFDHAASKGEIALSTWKTSQIHLGFTKEWR